jgi:hypothetical protein
LEPTLTERTEVTLGLLRAAAIRQNMTMSGDERICEADVAVLLGYDPKYIRQLRIEGRGPPAYRLGLANARVSYRLHDVAEFIELRRGDFDADD